MSEIQPDSAPLSKAPEYTALLSATINTPPIAHLGALLRMPDSEFPYKTGDFTLQNTANWSPLQYVAFGKWALTVVADGGKPQPLTRRHVRRLRILGYGPPAVDLGNFGDYKAAIGSPLAGDTQRHRGKFKHKSAETLIQQAAALSEATQGKLTKEGYLLAARAGLVAPIEIINEQIGGIKQLNDLIGYPHIPSWEREDFIAYGLDFLHVNPPDFFIAPAFNLLASRQRGPWERTIRERFIRWGDYKEEVMKLWQSAQDERLARLKRYRSQIETGGLPASFQEFDDNSLLLKAGRYRVATECVRGIDADEATTIANQNNDWWFTYKLRRYGKYITNGHIEMIAASRGILDDIQPPKPKHHLRITDDEIAAARAARQEKLARFREKRRSAKAAP